MLVSMLLPQERWLSVLLIFAMLYVQTNLVSAVLCPLTSEAKTSSLPRGWRKAARRFHAWLGCETDDLAWRRLRVTEDYLEGLTQPAVYFQVELRKREAAEKVGFDVSKKTDYFEVTKVHGAGPLGLWNAAVPSKAVERGDRIIEVNRIIGSSSKMVDEMRMSVNVTMTVLRLSGQDHKELEQKRFDKELRKVLKVEPPPGLGEGLKEAAASKVIALHARNIDEYLDKQPLAVLMVYASWCGHCKAMAPEYTRAANLVADMELHQKVQFVKYDGGDRANQENIGDESRLNITSFPAFFIVTGGKHEPFYDLRSAEEIAAYVNAKARGEDPETAIKRVLFDMRPMMYRADTEPSVVLDLEPELFDETVLTESSENNRIWIIEYYSDTCPFCRSLKPEYIAAAHEVAQDLGTAVRFAAINSRAFGDLAKRFGVTSYPWIISIFAGRKGKDMTGLGGKGTIVNWAKEQHKQLWAQNPTWAKPEEWPASHAEAVPVTASELAENTTGSWREILGRRTWFFLHTAAAKYPEEPTEADQVAMKGLVASLGQHYPCPVCRQHLQEKLSSPALRPVQTAKRTDLTKWFCQLHNMVNRDLGKAEHSCNAFELDLKYLKSCGECSVSKVKSWDYFKAVEASVKDKSEL